MGSREGLPQGGGTELPLGNLCKQSRGWVWCVATSILTQLKCGSGAQICLCLCILSPL